MSQAETKSTQRSPRETQKLIAGNLESIRRLNWGARGISTVLAKNILDEDLDEDCLTMQTVADLVYGLGEISRVIDHMVEELEFDHKLGVRS